MPLLIYQSITATTVKSKLPIVLSLNVVLFVNTIQFSFWISQSYYKYFLNQSFEPLFKRLLQLPLVKVPLIGIWNQVFIKKSLLKKSTLWIRFISLVVFSLFFFLSFVYFIFSLWFTFENWKINIKFAEHR